ncbi:MAG: hypothetical protein ACYTBJ_12490 [Planctomycetota bacterium]|jgi:hypothetical protein
MASGPAYEADPEGKAGGEQAIPKERVNAMIAAAKADAETRAAKAEERARLEAELRRDLEARSRPPATPPSKSEEKAPLSRAQLRLLMDEGKITQDEMDAEIERQIEARVEQRVTSTQDVKSRAVQINTEIDKYIERVSDLKDPTSDNRKRVQVEYAKLRKLNYPDDASTELVALRAVLGDLDKIEIPETGHKDREVDQTTHSSGGGEDAEPEQKGPGPLEGLKPEFVEYYTKGIEEGRYKGWDDPHLQKIMKREVDRK